MSEARTAVICEDVCKRYEDGDRQVEAVSELSMTAGAGKVTAVVGPSGSGKTTLLHLVGGIEFPDSGQVRVLDTDLADLSRTEQTAFRAAHVSFVFADMNLLTVLTAYENVTLGLSLLRLPEPEVHRRALKALESVGLADKAHRLPAKLSSGERQRVAVARAMARESGVVIADEPTAHLDHELAMEITGLLGDLARRTDACVLVATHDPAVADRADTVVRLEDGRAVT